jgi:ligand-binding sensor domain-containing protein
MRIRVFIFLMFGLFEFAAAQQSNIGMPMMQGYSRHDYRGGTQNWGFVQSPEGVLFIANNEGVLEFNGQDWNKYPLPNQTIVRSIALDDTGKLFVGGQDEAGYFEADEYGRLKFHSIKPLIPKNASRFEDVWDILALPQGVFFRASDNIYHLYQGRIQVFSTGKPIVFLGGWDDNIFIQDADGQVLKFTQNRFTALTNRPTALRPGITEVLNFHPDTMLLATENAGIYYYTSSGFGQWTIPDQAFLLQNRIQAASILPGSRLAIATAHGGLLILDPDRKARYLLGKADGLQNNNVRSVFTDADNHLWLGLDNGIDYVLTGSPFTAIQPDGPLEGTAYAACIHQQNIYFGTSNGLFAAPWHAHYNPFAKSTRFRLVPNTNGQVWGLGNIGNELFLGHHEGAFVVQAATARKISPEMGYWMFLPLPGMPNLFAGGNYYGISLYQKQSPGEWVFQQKIPGLSESSRIMATDEDGALWMSHPYRGIFRIPDSSLTAPPKVQFFGTAQGLPSDLQNHIFSIKNEIVATAREGIYRFDANQNRFIPHEIYNPLLGPQSRVRRLVEDARGNVWYAMEGEVGVLWVKDRGLQKEIVRQVFPELKNRLVGGFEFIYPYDSHNVFFGSEKGFIHFNPQEHSGRNRNLKTIISSVVLIAEIDSLIYAGHGSPGKTPKFHSRMNAFRFFFALPHYETWQPQEFQVMLEGLEDVWSDWSEKSQREFTNLPPGKYLFRVRSRLSPGENGEEAAFAFEILPPWYATRIALTLFMLCFASAIAGLIWIPQRKFQQERERMKQESQQQEEAHRQAARQSEEEIMRLRNEKLEAEVAFKTKEMASTTLHLLQKSELLHKIGEDLQKLHRKIQNPESQKEIRKLIAMLQDDTRLDNDWAQFAQHFDQVHSDFFKRIRDKFPQLTPKDLKLCAYLRLNLSSKEIAPLMNISVRGVEISRYRLRKKLELETDENLTDFFMNF